MESQVDVIFVVDLMSIEYVGQRNLHDSCSELIMNSIA
jgi:hypothetical protein